MNRVVIVICDSLRTDLITHARRAVSDRARRSARRGLPITRACFPRPRGRVRPRSRPGACRRGTVCSATRWRSTRATGSSAYRSASPISATGCTARPAGPCTRRPSPSGSTAVGETAIAFSNVSPGAAYFLDPDGYGWVYNPAGSYGPGRRPLPAEDGLAISQGRGRRHCRDRAVLRGGAAAPRAAPWRSCGSRSRITPDTTRRSAHPSIAVQ